MLAIQRAQAAGERGDGSERGACGGERSGAMAGPQLGAMCAAPAEAAALARELHGEGSPFRQVSGCLQRAEASAAAPALGSPPTRAGAGETAWPRGPLRAPRNPSPFRRAWRGRGRGRSGEGKEESCGSQEDLPPASLRPRAPGCGLRGGTGQRRGRGARTGEDGAENKGPSAQSAELLPAHRHCPPEPFRFTSAALPARLGWFLSERGFAVLTPPSDRAKGTRRKGILTGEA